VSWLLAAIYDRFMSESEAACVASWRAELLSELDGDVLEVGAGTGHNLPHYPPNVARLVLSEPDRHMRARLSRKLRACGASSDLSDAPAEHLPLPDASFDAVVATLVLCSVADPCRALAEIRRVLKPGGRFVFIEHVAAHDNPRRLRWQRRIEPLWKRIAGGCHVTRCTDQLIAQAGFDIERIERQSIRKAMPHVRPSIRGVARKPT
jgi:ubiquinone/menaquinone biosynthesis C-methylase UbiE